VSLRESDITAAIMDYLRLKGAWVFKVRGALGQRRGVPDVLFCIKGRFGAIEVKVPGRVPTERQAEELRAIEAAGGVAIVATCVEHVIRCVEGAG
jgi:hypothetical protein